MLTRELLVICILNTFRENAPRCTELRHLSHLGFCAIRKSSSSYSRVLLSISMHVASPLPIVMHDLYLGSLYLTAFVLRPHLTCNASIASIACTSISTSSKPFPFPSPFESAMTWHCTLAITIIVIVTVIALLLQFIALSGFAIRKRYFCFVLLFYLTFCISQIFLAWLPKNKSINFHPAPIKMPLRSVEICPAEKSTANGYQ